MTMNTLRINHGRKTKKYLVKINFIHLPIVHIFKYKNDIIMLVLKMKY